MGGVEAGEEIAPVPLGERFEKDRRGAVGAVTWAAAREVAALGSELSAIRVQLLKLCETQRYTASELTDCGAPVQHPQNAQTHADERHDSC